MRIKLVAIAKDEAAYLPEWIFHHLFFGFDEIEIYVNFTSDTSYEILRKIKKKYPVKYKSAEYLLADEYDSYDQLLRERFLKRNRLQSRAYAEALNNARKDCFTHIMFLDIDEFWTPACFKKNIKEVLQNLSDPVGASFRWKNKVREIKQFGRPFQNEVYWLEKKQVKGITQIDRIVEIMNSHYCTYLDRNTNKVTDPREQNTINDISTAFILHRFQRSETEYISMLGRGDPTSAGKFNLKFTRSGYQRGDTAIKFKFDSNLVREYDEKYQEFIENSHIGEELAKGKEFVLAQKRIVLDYIKKNIKTYNIIKKITPGLTLNDDILTELNLSKGLSETQINLLRDMAIELENKDLNKAYELMKIAYTFKPQAPFIKRKLEKYKSSLEKK